jgi:hypothetical protein
MTIFEVVYGGEDCSYITAYAAAARSRGPPFVLGLGLVLGIGLGLALARAAAVGLPRAPRASPAALAACTARGHEYRLVPRGTRQAEMEDLIHSDVPPDVPTDEPKDAAVSVIALPYAAPGRHGYALHPELSLRFSSDTHQHIVKR